MQRTIIIVLLFTLMICFSQAADAQCAMCKAIVESSSQEAGMLGGSTDVGEGLNKGIIFLMTIPYILIFILFRKHIGTFFREMNQAQG